MRRRTTTQTIHHPEVFKNQLLSWGATHKTSVWLDSNVHNDPYGSFDALLAVGVVSKLCLADYRDAFTVLKKYQQETADWIFGYFTYDLKNDLEDLSSHNPDRLQYPALYFFQPKKIFTLRGNELRQLYVNEVQSEAEQDIEVIQKRSKSIEKPDNKLKIRSGLSKTAYLDRVRQMQQLIHRGDIYEANFCQEFFAEGNLDPLATFNALNTSSSAPFAAYLKMEEKHVLCTSPERYLRKNANKIISQPIKGTAKRSKNPVEDAKIGQNLLKNEKERSENIMITDLVRNDLSRIAKKGSVKVEELCGLYSFKQVHQLISTISTSVNPGTVAVDLIKNTFPMGSMTGAPKLSAMKIIEQLEVHKRGLYSGSIGYFTPKGDFDFNVVIRSILYNAQKEYVSFSVGSAITASADPEKEYEECMLKARAMREVLSG